MDSSRRLPLPASYLILTAAFLALTVGSRPAAAGPVRLKSIAIDPVSVDLAPGQTKTFRAVGSYSDSTTKNITTQVKWSSKKSTVATVDAKGVVTALASGETEIGAFDAASGVSASQTAKVTVGSLKTLSITPGSGSLGTGGTLQLHAIGSFSNGLTNVDVTNVVAWESSSTALATVATGAPTGDGLVTGVKAGTVTITASDRSSKVSTSGTYKVVKVGPLQSIKVSPTIGLATVKHSKTFKAIGSYGQGITLDISSSVKWTSSNPDVGTVDATGKATGVSLGVSVISVKDPATGMTSTSTAGDAFFHVVGALTALQCTPASVSVHIGKPKGLKALGTFVGASIPLPFKNVQWTSSSTSNATVDPQGVVTCVLAGPTTVSVKDPQTGIDSGASSCLVTCK